MNSAPKSRCPCKAAKRNAGRETILIDGIETIPADIQLQLARSIEDGILSGGPRIIALSLEDTPGNSPGLSPELRAALSALSIRLPAFAERTGGRADIATELLPMLASRMGMKAPVLDDSATKLVEDHAWPGNLHQMRGVLSATLASHSNLGPITAEEIATQLSRLATPVHGGQRRCIRVVPARNAGGGRGILPPRFRAIGL
ncbi:hypothetical protein LP421_29945 (plasmid) [Rhizobium sp. RCAM05350]|nr:hypothetical protein LP421_29945 [Rhizobium sp. RCAM05350]